MSLKKVIVLLFCLYTFNIFSQDIGEKTKEILSYLNRNNLGIYKDGSILSNNRVVNQHIYELIQRIGKSNSITFIVRTKSNGLYNASFMIKDNDNNLNGKLLGSLVPITEKSNGTSTMYPIENLDTITLVYRYKEKEELLLNDYIYLLNSMLYKDETLSSMIKQKVENKENESTEDKSRLSSMTRDLLQNKDDIIIVSNKIIDNYKKENNSISQKTNKSQDDLDIINENNSYIKVYNTLINNMKESR